MQPLNNSHLTAITRKTLSAPMKILSNEIQSLDPRTVLDYGCGKGFDADYFNIDKYDPYFFDERKDKKYSLITCNYVLCVVPELEQNRILHDVHNTLEDNGVAFFTVRRDAKNIKGFTKRKTLQRYVILDMDIYYELKSHFCIYKYVKKVV